MSSSPPPRLRVALLHNYRDSQQSMRLYAAHLGEALLHREVNVTRIKPPAVVPASWRTRSTYWAKVDAYVGRFAVYPRLVRNLDVDVTHVVDHGQGYLLSEVDGRRTVVTCHDVILLALAAGRISAAPAPPVALHLLRISLELMKRAAVVVADSSQTKQDLVRFVGVDPEHVRIIHPGLNLAFAPNAERRAAFRNRFGLGDAPVMLQIGRKFYKNVAGALRVLERVRRLGISARMARIGPALSEDERALARRLGVLDAVVELGEVSDDLIPAAYNAADLLLFPSLYEGFGWPPLEAMASGTPVVCSRAGSLDEVVADAALTADAEDVEALAWHAASALCDERVRGVLVLRGLARAGQFTWQRTAAQMIEVYGNVAAKAA